VAAWLRRRSRLRGPESWHLNASCINANWG
jgi:hypothetical protein